MDYDLDLFLKELEQSQLIDDDTLVVLTADHCCPTTPAIRTLPGATNSPFDRIPLVLLSPRLLPLADRNRATSQLDVAPSILHLLGLPVPQGYWGRSVCDASSGPSPFVGISQGSVTIEDGKFLETIDLARPETEMQAGLCNLLKSCLRSP